MITNFIHDLAALLPLLSLMLTLHGDIEFCFGTPEQRLKVVNFDISKKPPPPKKKN